MPSHSAVIMAPLGFPDLDDPSVHSLDQHCSLTVTILCIAKAWLWARFACWVCLLEIISKQFSKINLQSRLCISQAGRRLLQSADVTQSRRMVNLSYNSSKVIVDKFENQQLNAVAYKRQISLGDILNNYFVFIQLKYRMLFWILGQKSISNCTDCQPLE